MGWNAATSYRSQYWKDVMIYIDVARTQFCAGQEVDMSILKNILGLSFFAMIFVLKIKYNNYTHQK